MDEMLIYKFVILCFAIVQKQYYVSFVQVNGKKSNHIKMLEQCLFVIIGSVTKKHSSRMLQ